MKVRLNKTGWRAIGGIVASFILVVSFQNCGKAGFDSNLESELDTGLTDAQLSAKYGESTGAKVSSVPFAFEATFDTITYNSCTDTSLRNNSAFTSLKAGAYSTGGVKIKDDFFTYADQNFKPIYPNTTLTENQYKDFLADSPKNNGAVATMALRVKNSLTQVYTANGSNVTLWTDVIPLVGNLTDTLVMDAYTKKGVTANYFPFSPEQKVMEGGMNFNTSESLADQYRDILANAGVLALTYMASNSEIYKVRADSTDYPVKKAYGKAYSLVFSPALGAVNNPSRLLTQVNETDLNTPSVGGRAWNCTRQYKIVRLQDRNTAGASYCPELSYTDLKNATIRAEVAIARRQLRADQWDINPVYRCAVPKGGTSCYNEQQNAGAPIVQYDPAQQCLRSQTEAYNYTPPTPNSKCMHYISICTRD